MLSVNDVSVNESHADLRKGAGSPGKKCIMFSISWSRFVISWGIPGSSG